jgi:hypothetical protein
MISTTRSAARLRGIRIIMMVVKLSRFGMACPHWMSIFRIPSPQARLFGRMA